MWKERLQVSCWPAGFLFHATSTPTIGNTGVTHVFFCISKSGKRDSPFNAVVFLCFRNPWLTFLSSKYLWRSVNALEGIADPPPPLPSQPRGSHALEIPIQCIHVCERFSTYVLNPEFPSYVMCGVAAETLHPTCKRRCLPPLCVRKR